VTVLATLSILALSIVVGYHSYSLYLKRMEEEEERKRAELEEEERRKREEEERAQENQP
jgi:hypothetical protein